MIGGRGRKNNPDFVDLSQALSESEGTTWKHLLEQKIILDIGIFQFAQLTSELWPF